MSFRTIFFLILQGPSVMSNWNLSRWEPIGGPQRPLSRSSSYSIPAHSSITYFSAFCCLCEKQMHICIKFRSLHLKHFRNYYYYKISIWLLHMFEIEGLPLDAPCTALIPSPGPQQCAWTSTERFPVDIQNNVSTNFLCKSIRSASNHFHVCDSLFPTQLLFIKHFQNLKNGPKSCTEIIKTHTHTKQKHYKHTNPA